MKIRNTRVTYKVARTDYSTPCGVGQSVTLETHRVIQYTINHLAKPKATANPFLFVFSKLKDAKNFAGGVGPRLIYKGIAINTKTRAKGIVKVFYSRDYPRGTLFCEAFLPLEVVK